MNAKYVSVNGGSKIEIVASKVSPVIMDKAKTLVTKIFSDEVQDLR